MQPNPMIRNDGTRIWTETIPSELENKPAIGSVGFVSVDRDIGRRNNAPPVRVSWSAAGRAGPKITENNIDTAYYAVTVTNHKYEGGGMYVAILTEIKMLDRADTL